MLVFGDGFGVSDGSPQTSTRLRATPSFSSWNSDSSIALKLQNFYSLRSSSILLSICHEVLSESTTINTTSWEIRRSSYSRGNEAPVGSSSTILTVAGYDFRNNRHSNIFRISGTSGESTIWQSDSSIRIKCAKLLSQNSLISCSSELLGRLVHSF